MDTPHVEILKLTFEVFIALCGFIGNVLVAIVISAQGRNKKPSEFYVQNLAMADVGTLVLTFPLAAIKEKVPYNWPFGEFICLYFYPVPEIFYGASVWFIAVIAIERYRIATVKITGQNKNKILVRRAKVIAACVWVMSFLTFCLPLYFVVEYSELPDDGKACGPVWNSWDRDFVLARVYVGLLTLFSYIVPLVVISLTYLAISRKINQSSALIKAENRQQEGIAEERQSRSATNVKNVRLEQNKRAKKILTPMVLVFAGAMLPLTIFRLTMAFWPAFTAQEYYRNILYAVTVFVILNSSANPIIYSVVSAVFRKNVFRTCLGNGY